MGMLSEVVGDEQTIVRALELATEIAALPPLAVAQIKEVGCWPVLTCRWRARWCWSARPSNCYSIRATRKRALSLPGKRKAISQENER